MSHDECIYSELQLHWKIIFPFLAKSHTHTHMRMGTRLCKEWENNFPTQLQFTVCMYVCTAGTGICPEY